MLQIPPLSCRCRGCHEPAGSFETVLKMEPMPLAGSFAVTREDALASPLFPLTWVSCHSCGLLQVLEDISDDLLFSSYNYASSSIVGLVKHFDAYANFLAERYDPRAPLRALEVGCNDGVLLRRLPSAWNVVGVDPSDVARKAACCQTRYTLFNQAFSSRFVESEGLEGKFDVITGSNCLAHISDLKDVFVGVHAALDHAGHFWLEVHDCDSLLDTNQWDTIYHEHKAEWSERSAVRCIEPIGFSHVVTHKLSLHGGLLRMCFEKTTAKPIVRLPDCRPDPRLSEIRHAYETRYESPAVHLLAEIQSTGGSLAAFGASGRANVFLNQLQRLRFSYIVDQSPLRASKFLPHVAVPVVPVETFRTEPVDVCLITAWNYKEQIIANNGTYSGRWVSAF